MVLQLAELFLEQLAHACRIQVSVLTDRQCHRDTSAKYNTGRVQDAILTAAVRLNQFGAI
jgi:hypothetical protein